MAKRLSLLLTACALLASAPLQAQPTPAASPSFSTMCSDCSGTEYFGDFNPGTTNSCQNYQLNIFENWTIAGGSADEIEKAEQADIVSAAQTSDANFHYYQITVRSPDWNVASLINNASVEMAFGDCTSASTRFSLLLSYIFDTTHKGSSWVPEGDSKIIFYRDSDSGNNRVGGASNDGPAIATPPTSDYPDSNDGYDSDVTVGINDAYVRLNTSGGNATIEFAIRRTAPALTAVANPFSPCFGRTWTNMTSTTPKDGFAINDRFSTSDLNSTSWAIDSCTEPVVFGEITIRKETDPDGNMSSFGFTATGGLSPTAFNLSDGGSQLLTTTAALGATATTYTITESSLPANWSLSSINCSGGDSITVDLANDRVDIDLTTTNSTADCTFNNLLPPAELSLVKGASPATYSMPGQVISYTYDVTNTGGSPVAGPVTVADDIVDGAGGSVTCPAATTVGNNDSNLDPGETIQCTAAYTITQGDIDSGSVTNTAMASAGALDSNEDTETVNAIQNPALTLVKGAAPTTYNSVGQVISYTYDVTNSGNTTLAGPVTVADDQETVSCPALTTIGNNDGNLDPGETVQCTASHTVIQADIDAGSISNVATASADSVNSNQDSETVTAQQNPALSLTKAASPSSYDTVGQVISYTYDVSNSGNTTLAGPVSVTDDQETVSCPALTTIGNNDGNLDPGETVQCTASHTVTQADIDAGSITNVATASADSVNSNQDSETVTAQQNPALSLSKAGSPTTYDTVGQVISYTYDVTNTGNTTLAGPVTVADDQETVSCPALTTIGNNDGNLDPGETVQCTASHTVTQADIDAGSITNVATATADSVNSNQDSETVTAQQNPALTLSKDASPSTYDTVGQVISYTYDVTNTGNTTLAGPVTVADDQETVSCPALTTIGNNDGNLDPGETVQCTASRTVTQADIDAGSITNVATATADSVNSNQDSETVTAQQNPALTLSKDASPSTYDTVGQVISYTYDVTNTGNTTLAGPVTVADDQETVSCPALTTIGNNDGNLDPGETVQCTASRTVTQADIDAGSITNVATATADSVNSNQDSETVTAQQNPQLTLVKAASPSTYDTVGQVISYTYDVTNSGNTTLAGPVSVSDDQETVSCPALTTIGNNDGNLDPGETVQCTASRSITQADIDAGSITNVATASADSVNSNQDSETVTAQQNPQLTLVKAASPATYDTVGQVISYTYDVTNSGNTTLAGPVSVSDDQETVSCPALTTIGNNDGNLDPGETVQCIASRSISQADIDAGSITNVATATADSVNSNQDSETVTAQQNPQLTLVKAASPATYDTVGQVISYTYDVTNSGNTTLAGPVSVSDDQETVSCPALTTIGNNDGNLDPGETVQCTASRSITQADIDAGSITNVATASADSVNSNQDSETVTAQQNPQLTLVKAASPATYDTVGQVISYTYDVTNSGNTTLAVPVSVSDDQETVSCPALTTIGNNDGNLDPGETVQCTASHTIIQADINAGSITNVATATADSVNSNQDTETIVATQNQSLTLVKSASPTAYSTIAQLISYTYDVTNTGNTTLAGPVTVSDDQETVSCPALTTIGNNDGNLDPGETIQCTASRSITQADIDAGSISNVATATVDSVNSNQDSETVTAQQTRALLLAKNASPTTYASVGQVIGYTYDVTNSGNTTLAGPVSVSDDQETVSCPALTTIGNNDGNLDPGETVQCTASRSITQADIDAGSISNVATASADSVNSNQDSETVTAQQNPALSLVKVASPGTYDALGQVISYTYDVTNTGNTTLAGPVSVTDDQETVSCPALTTIGNNDANLDPGETVQCTASRTITQADIDAGSISNVATASADSVNSNQDTETVTAQQNPALSLTKNASPTTYDSVGQIISYTYDVTNSGNTILTGPVTVADDQESVSCPALTTIGNNDGNLDPGETVQCTASRTITQVDIDAGSITNIATATADSVNSNQDTETVTAQQNPALSLSKSASPASYDTVGQVISYTYDVTNSGNTTLAGPVTVADDQESVSCPALTTIGNNDGNLDPGETVQCTASRTITQLDIDAGSITNIATATADSVNSNQDTETVSAQQNQELSLAKSANPTTYDAVGQVISYTYDVTNSGNTTLAGPVTVADDQESVSCPALTTIGNNDGNLDPGETVQCTASHSITQADIDAGSLSNIATATADSVNSNQDSETVSAQQTPVLSLAKAANPTTYGSVGEVINYSYAVSNSGNTTLAGPVTVSDDQETVTCPALSTIGNNDGNLDPGETVQCTASHTITQADIDAGSLSNIATATADSANSNQDSETVTAQQTPALSLAKNASPTTYASVGQVISYTYDVTNTGNSTLAGPVSVNDDQETVNCPAVTTVGNNDANLDPGETVQCTASRAITQADIDAGSISNIATATADSVSSNQDTETVTAQQNAELSLTKAANPMTYDSPGQIISYSYDVTNSGNTTLAGPVTVNDDQVTVSCPTLSTIGNNDGNLDPGETVQCTASYAITQGDINAGSIINVATASADGIDSNPDMETVIADQTSALSLDKIASPVTYDAAGQFISYTYLVSNVGNTSLAGPVTVTDNQETVTCPDVVTVGNNDANLDPAESIVCTASRSISSSDLLLPSITNIAIASADSVDSNSDMETITNNHRIDRPVQHVPLLSATGLAMLISLMLLLGGWTYYRRQCREPLI